MIVYFCMDPLYSCWNEHCGTTKLEVEQKLTTIIDVYFLFRQVNVAKVI
jgi:hypothetical protein